jgi:hypothetical protein
VGKDLSALDFGSCPPLAGKRKVVANLRRCQAQTVICYIGFQDCPVSTFGLPALNGGPEPIKNSVIGSGPFSGLMREAFQDVGVDRRTAVEDVLGTFLNTREFIENP